MFDHITLISDRGVSIKLTPEAKASGVNLMNMHVVLVDGDKVVVGEVEYIKDDIIDARFLGEIVDGKFRSGVIAKPGINAQVRLMDPSEITMITGEDTLGNMTIGISPFYDNKRVYMSINELFSNHLTVLGNSGCGKSFGTTKLLQSVFSTPNFVPYKASFIMFDNNGEYISSFSKLSELNPNYNFKVITTNMNYPYDKLNIPVWLLSVDDIALLLAATTANQLTLIERMIKLTHIFSLSDDMSRRYQNHIMAKAMMSILYSNDLPTTKRNNVFNIFNTCTTNELNMEAVIQGAGYTRKFRDCFHIDANGVFTESILMNNYLASLIDPALDDFETSDYNAFTLKDMERALAFALISENWLNNPQTYSDAITIKVKLHSLAISDNAQFFNYPNFCNISEFLAGMLINNGHKNQIVNINIEDVDDMLAKTLVKILCRMIFEYAKALPDRGSVPFNLLVEEAHRYIKTGEDIPLLGYNIFDRISKEGRKYGVLITLISQRPVELSETVMSQCANFLIFKTTHPRDIEYITRMVPYITEELIEKQKGLQPGYCLAFGTAFKVPIIIKVDMPNPTPNSDNVDVVHEWSGQ